MKKLLRTSALAMMLAMTANMADARDLRVAPGAPPAHPANSHLYSKLVDYLKEESGGSLTATMIGPEVVSIGQMKDALQSNLAEVGNLLPLYFPADLPNMALVGEMALAGRNAQAMGAAMTEYMVNCAPCQAEMSKFGVVYVGSGSSDVYAILSKKPVRTAADLKGLKLRSGGAPFSRWAEKFGAVPASMSVFATFESMSGGVIDGTMASVADLLSFRIVELAKYVTVLDLGTYHATSNFTVNKGVWDSLNKADREAFARAANRANADFTDRWGREMPIAAVAAAKKAGIEFIEPDADLVAATEAFAAADQKTAAEIAKERFGMDDAADRVATFVGLVDKWTKIVNEEKNDAVAIAKRVQTEVWDKVDMASYGK